MCFVAANGEKLCNRGQMCLKLDAANGTHLNSTFQVCDTTRPLWSVGRICDSGCSVTFDSKGAVVRHKETGKELCQFQRAGGLYIAVPVKLVRPTSFQRQGR